MSTNKVTEWFRKCTWTEEDQADFFAHLEQSEKPFHKAQYMRIQALHLQDVGTPLMYYSAIKLIETMLEQYPEPSQLSMAYLQKAECLDALGHVDEAVAAYREAVDALRAFPKAKTSAPVAFGMFAVTHELTELYDEVLDLLDEFSDRAAVSDAQYEYHAIRAVITGHKGDAEAARTHAREAINAAQSVYSGIHFDFKSHELIEKPQTNLHKKLGALAGLG